MKIYLAGRYGRRLELLQYATDLMAMGHEVTSRWLAGEHEMIDEQPDHESAQRFALEDLADLREANCLIAFTEEPGPVPGRARGGRHVELGYAICAGKHVCIVGHLENTFCHLPGLYAFVDFASLKTWLASMGDLARDWRGRIGQLPRPNLWS